MNNAKKIALFFENSQQWELMQKFVENLAKNITCEVLIMAQNPVLQEEIENTGHCVAHCGGISDAVENHLPDTVVLTQPLAEVLNAAPTTHIITLTPQQIDAITLHKHQNTRLLSAEGLKYSLLDFEINENTVFVNFKTETDAETQQLLETLDKILLTGKNILITTHKNDQDQTIKNWTTKNPTKTIWFKKMGNTRRLSILKYTGAVITNSKTDMLDAQLFHVKILEHNTLQTIAPTTTKTTIQQILNEIITTHHQNPQG